MSGRCEGKLALVTGAAQGLGRAHATRLAEEGARVLCTDINGEGAEETARLINGRLGDGTAYGVRHDVTDPDQWEAAVEAARDHLGGVLRQRHAQALARFGKAQKPRTGQGRPLRRGGRVDEHLCHALRGCA